MPESVPDVFVANCTFATEIDGVPTVIHKGVDRVRAGHPLLAQNPQFFDPVDLVVRFESAGIETATAAPGERRGEPTLADLRARAGELEIEGRSGMNKEQLAEAIAEAEG